MPKRRVQVPLPLFDRLVDHQPGLRLEIRPKRTLDRRGLRDSVRRELEQLLNTRASLPVKTLLGRPPTVLDYGLPDGAALSPARHDDRQRLARWMERVIEAFEPRLTRVQVELEPLEEDPRRLAGHIRAMLIVDRTPEPVSFETVLADEVSVQ